MPELPEVETVCRGLSKPMAGQKLARVDQRRKNLRIPFPAHLPEKLQNKTIKRIYRRAKYILMDLTGGQTLILHLGMSGSMTVHKNFTKPAKHDHLVFTLKNGTVVTFNDPRRFGLVDLAPQNTLDTHRFFKHLGPDALDKIFTGAYLYDILKTKKTNIKTALLDQRVVAGPGNIYVCEALYLAGIRPMRKTNRITRAEAAALVKALRQVLRAAIKSGGSSLKDYKQASGALGYFQHKWRVYDKAGDACKTCGATIRRIVQAGRSSFYCPGCQK